MEALGIAMLKATTKGKELVGRQDPQIRVEQQQGGQHHHQQDGPVQLCDEGLPVLGIAAR